MIGIYIFWEDLISSFSKSSSLGSPVKKAFLNLGSYRLHDFINRLSDIGITF